LPLRQPLKFSFEEHFEKERKNRMIDKKTNEPYMNIIFGNFYKPGYDDESFVDETMEMIRRLGYNSVMLDTKDSEDFRERVAGGEASTYVKMQEFMMKSAKKHGLTFNFLLLYLNGDNLYPHIRFSPPVYGEQIKYADGTSGRWYKYWSDKATDTMTEHVEQMMTLYRENYCECESKGKSVMPTCSMWDPIVCQSYDEEGTERYRKYLKKIYSDDIKKLNKAYSTGYKDFEEMGIYDLWYDLKFPEKEIPENAASMAVKRDNLAWKRDELTEYFNVMHHKLKKVVPEIFLCPDLSQWGYFLNIDGKNQCDHDNDYSDLWDTSRRGIDMYAIAPYVDCAHFITVPVTPKGDPDAYVVSCQHSMMKVMNEGRDKIGGIYWGRYIYRDIYSVLTPEEIVGTMAACGMDGYNAYGMNGLDDGGVLNRMDEDFCASLSRGNEWFKKVVKERSSERKKEVAVLFPLEMSDFEPFEKEGNEVRRLDLLGYYKLCSDLGYQVDVISNHEIVNGRLDGYKILVIPANDCYSLEDNSAVESKVKEWIENGGVLVHGPSCDLANKVFDLEEVKHAKKPWRYGKEKYIIAQGIDFSSYNKGEVLAEWKDGGSCLVRNDLGRGSIYSLGVQLGASYTSRNIPHVPYDENNNEMYPFCLSYSKVFEDILTSVSTPLAPVKGKGIETGVFENGYVIVNHKNVPVDIKNIVPDRKVYFTNNINGHTIMPHAAVWVEK